MVRGLPLLLLSCALLGCWHIEVVRVVDGIQQPGRFVSDVAYASYARGAEWEARGRLKEALAAYRAAADRDADSPEIWSRIGAVGCQLEQLGEAEEAFVEAEEIDADYEPLWRERARCSQRRGRTTAALTAAMRAVALDPQRDDTVLLLVELLQQAGQDAEAERWLRSLALRSPASLEVWEAVRLHARAAADDAWHLEAVRRLGSIGRRLGGEVEAAAGSPWGQVDRALLRGSLDDARTQLRRAHLDVRLLAARAIAVGRLELAREEAALRAAANPRDQDAHIALALAADLLGKQEDMVAAVAALPSEGEHLSLAGTLLLAELLWRRVGPDAARLWLGDSGVGEEPAGGASGPGQLRARLRSSFDEPPR